MVWGAASVRGRGMRRDPCFPVDAVVPRVREVLRRRSRCILEAPPGAGKTTRLPLALLEAAHEDGWLGEKSILILEPRRMAARNAAGYMAALLGERVGRTVGYEVRLERRPGTRVTLVTEGILTRRLQADPELSGVGCLIFDEFHERNLHGDLGLALALECQDALRPDLRILVMSATLESGPLAALLAGGEGESVCPVLRSEGRLWPVSTHYLPRSELPPALIDQRSDALFSAGHVAAAVRRALAEASGGILVFLPGAREIRQVRALLGELAGVRLHVLHGDLPPAAQDAALAPASGADRKVVLSTAIAETSLTIEGISVVIDAGLSRTVRSDPGTGLERLVTTRVSLAGAEQRRGRAGRIGPGVCYRLWSEADEAGFPPSRKPEILEADLASLRLELAVWGARDVAALRWLDMPPRPAMQRATDLLRQLGALDEADLVTRRGRLLAELPLHPRLGHMVLGAKERDLGGVACLLAALLEARDPLARERPGVDIRRRLAWLLDHRADASSTTAGRLWEAGRQIGRRVGLDRLRIDDADCEQSGLLLALAYPDRVAQRRGRGRFRMVNGRGAAVADDDPLADFPFLAIGSLAGEMGDSRVFQAAPLAVDTVKTLFESALARRVRFGWDSAAEAAVGRTELCLGALVVEDAPLPTPDDETCRAAVCEGIRTLGLDCLPWTASTRSWRDRVMFLRRLEGGSAGGDVAWPDLSDAALLHSLENWLGPFLRGISRRAQFKTIDLANALRALLSHDGQRRLDAEAPTHLAVPSGSRIALDYSACGGAGEGAPRPPVLAVKLQELFGLTTTPTVASGRVPVLIHLLSPAGRPLQVTQDLSGFWKTGYPAVRAEMRGRYPRHPWPEDPLAALPTRRAKARPQTNS